MCYHKRLIYTCFHNAWGPEVLPCDIQRAYLSRRIDYECEIMYAHPRHSIMIQTMCQECAKRKAKTDVALLKVRGILRLLNESMERMRRMEKEGGDGDEGVGIEEEKETPTKDTAENKANENGVDENEVDENEVNENEEMEMLSVIEEEGEK